MAEGLDERKHSSNLRKKGNNCDERERGRSNNCHSNLETFLQNRRGILY